MSDLGLWPRLWMAWVALGCAAGTAKGSNPLLAKFLPGHEGDDGPYLELRSDSPAVLDAPLTIYATLKNEDASNAPFFFSFTDDASPMQYKEIKSQNLTANFSVTYSSDTYEDREYTMTVRVYEMFTIFRNEIAKGTISYRITRSLNGHLVAVQNGTERASRQGRATIQAAVNTDFQVRMHDPSGFLNDANITYFWFVNETNYGSTNGSSFPYNFKSIGDSVVEVMVLAKIPGIGSYSGDFHDKIAIAQNPKGMVEEIEIPRDTKMGLFRLVANPRVPMTNVVVTGDKWLKHGKLLNLSVTCDGSGPWTFCWHIKDSTYNSTGDETCGDNYEIMTTCSFNIIWYFRNSGASAVLIIVDNVLNHEVKQVGINVYDVPRRTPVSLIVIPLCSGLIAVIACISGIFVFMTFKRNMTGLETADFDFSCPDEQLEYKTFWERLRDSMLNALSNANKDDVSHISSVSSRSVQGPPVGIHYGSIT